MVSLHKLYNVSHVHHIKSHTFISAVQLKGNLCSGHEDENKNNNHSHEVTIRNVCFYLNELNILIIYKIVYMNFSFNLLILLCLMLCSS